MTRITFNCPHCNHQLATDASKAGMNAKCSKCQEPIVIPLDGGGQTLVNFAGGREAFPAYSYRQVLQADRYPDRAAVDHGLNGIAYPADGIVEYARSSGLEPDFYEYCCSLTWSDL